MKLTSMWEKKTRLLTGLAAIGTLAVVAGWMMWNTPVHADGRAPLHSVMTQTKVVAGVVPTEGFADVVSKAAPAVVSVATTRVIRTSDRGRNPLFEDPFFRQFFGGGIPRMGPQRERGLGSGVIVSSDGYILTNSHVVDKATKILVRLADKREFQGKVVGTDPRTDIAVLKIGATGLPTLPFGDSSRVRVGDIVLAIGQPFGVGQTVTMGIVSATGRGGLGIEDYEDFIQTDAAINPGNSGGPLINNRGEIIGINTAIIGPSGGNNGIGFAVPVNLAHNVMDQILKNGKVIRGYLGAIVQDVTPAIAKQFGVKGTKGALLGDVQDGTAADEAGLKRGDIITAINGKPVEDARRLRLAISLTPPGTTVKLTVVRNGKPMEVSVKLRELPDEMAKSGAPGVQSGTLDGVEVDELTPRIARQLGLDASVFGVVITDVDPNSSAYDAGLRRGDVIQEVNHKPIRNKRDFEAAARAAGDGPVLLLVNRGGNTMFLAIEP